MGARLAMERKPRVKRWFVCGCGGRVSWGRKSTEEKARRVHGETCPRGQS